MADVPQTTTTTTTTSSGCQVCGVPARYSCYGAVVCQSCKIFFKRHVKAEQTVSECRFDSKCDVNINNRHVCSSCRLKKCFAIGMRSDMIRSSHPPKKKKRIQKKKTTTDSTSSMSTALVTQGDKNQSEHIPTLNLLQSDRSTLNAEQWNLLSNLVHCFDEHSGYSLVERFIQEQDALPPKLRSKYSYVKDFFTSMKAKVQLVFEKNRDFLSLSSHERITLLRTTAEYTSTIGGMFLIRQARLFDDPSFYESSEMLFRPTATAFFKCVIDKLDPDDTFIKLILSILSFSTVNYTVYTKFDPTNMINVKAILPTHDMYTELAWRYVLHKYGHDQAVIRFSNLLRCLFFLNNAIVEAHESKEFTEMIVTIIQQTEQILCS